MADETRQNFAILEDATTKEAAPVHKALPGDAEAGKNSVPTFSFKDSSGNLVRPQLLASGAIKVSDEEDGSQLSDVQKVVGNLAYTDVCEISPTASSKLVRIYAKITSMRSFEYELVAIQDPDGTPVETLLDHGITQPGEPIGLYNPQYSEVTVGATTPVIRLRAKNLIKASDFRGTLKAVELS